MVYSMTWRAWRDILYDLVGMAWYELWPDETWYVCPGWHGMVYGMAWWAGMVCGMA